MYPAHLSPRGEQFGCWHDPQRSTLAWCIEMGPEPGNLREQSNLPGVRSLCHSSWRDLGRSENPSSSLPPPNKNPLGSASGQGVVQQFVPKGTGALLASPGSNGIHLAEGLVLSKPCTHHDWHSCPDRAAVRRCWCPGCRVCSALVPVPDGNSEHPCGRCAQAEELLRLVMELWEEVSRLWSIREPETADCNCTLPSIGR